MTTITKILITMVAVLVADYLFDGIQVAENFWGLARVAIVLAFLNAILRPILIVLTIPLTIITLGLFLLVINALVILLADKLLDGFSVDGFWYALLLSFILSITNSLFEKSEKKKKARN
ncbi:MAG: putative membrane protein [Flavobacteriales bacterium]|jgi:putative membrane protein